MTKLAAVFGIAVAAIQPPSTSLYRDPANRFTFSYPATFGSATRGTDDGFGDRVAAVAFSAFPARLKGEAVLMRGFPMIDLQAAGGLYDNITLQIFPDAARAVVVAQLPRLSAANLCAALAQSQHLDPGLRALASLPPAVRESIVPVDTMRNASPRMVQCRAVGDTVLFDKERSFRPGDPVQHVYGAVRFLPPPFSAFQIVAGGEPPDAALLASLQALVNSLRLQ